MRSARSSPNPSSSSTGGRPRRSATHSETFRLSTGGGAIAQIARPRRWIRNRPPASTSLRSFEKERLASVADRTSSALSDFLAIYLIIPFTCRSDKRRACLQGDPLIASTPPTFSPVLCYWLTFLHAVHGHVHAFRRICRLCARKLSWEIQAQRPDSDRWSRHSVIQMVLTVVWP